MKEYTKPKIDSTDICLNDVILISFVDGGHSIFDYNDEV